MKKTVIIIGLTMFLASCAGYFGAKGGADNPAEANPLAIEGGGYLSTDTHNEITPFLYRDTNGQNPVLFYSSDRDGTYDIYYVRMNPDGTFQQPVKMGTNVNAKVGNYDEISPVLFVNNGYFYFYFIRINNDNGYRFVNGITNIVDQNFSINTIDTNQPFSPFMDSHSNICSLGIENSEGYHYLHIFYGSSNSIKNSFTNKLINNEIKFGASGIFNYFSIGQDSSISNEFWVYETTKSGNRQLSIFAYATYTYLIMGVNSNIAPTNQGIPPAYASTYNDRQPCVDWLDPEQKGQVYFSSDRAGTYDLYRYNIETISKLVDYYPFAEWLTNNGYL